MTESMNDDELLTLLAESLAEDRPPAAAIDAAYAAFEWRNLDADLARLLEDSQIEVVLFDTAAYSRVLSYIAEHGSVEVGVDYDRFEVVVSPRPQSVRLCQPDGHIELDVDADGRATADGITGSVRFEITWADGSTTTPWLTL